MTDRLEEALAALREDTAAESSGEATLDRIRRSLAASDDASERALDAALGAEVQVLYGEGDRLLDLAVDALREPAGSEAESDGRDTLARIRRSLAAREGALEARAEGDGLVELAAAAWREETATRAEAAPDAGAPPTRIRVLATLDARRARSRWALAAAAALALAVLPPTAWAWSTGRLERWIASVAVPSTSEETASPSGAREREERAPSVAPRAGEPGAPPAPDAPGVQEESVTPPSTGEPDVGRDVSAPSPAIARAPSRDSRARRRGGAAVVPAEPAIAPRQEPAVASNESSSTEPADPAPALDSRERELFARAHHLHFGGGPQTATLAAWDDYLRAFPRGHYAPEARYNRALTLVRLGRIEEARRVLARFAAAPAGSYRRDEARALVDALGASVTAE